jgi:glycosyltransferase involved in cell wall biosynthesis
MRVLHFHGSRTYVEGRMQAIDAATTEWVALMDADDIALPDRLARQMEFLEIHGDDIGALGTSVRQITGTGRRLGSARMGAQDRSTFLHLMTIQEPVSVYDPTAILHRPTFYAVGGYRTEAVPAADLDLYYRIAETGRMVLSLPDVLVHYRIHGAAQSVESTLLQRSRCHFINHNMRRRRRGQTERSPSEFAAWIRRRPLKRLRWFFNDHGMTFYKRAGIAYGAGNRISFAWNLCIGLACKPSQLWNRLLPQLLPRFFGGSARD